MQIAFTAVVSLVLVLAVAHGDIAYDNLTGRDPITWSASSVETAQDIRLEPGTGLLLTSFSLSFFNIVSDIADEGSITMSLYTDVGGQPGDLVVSETFDFSLGPREARVYTIDIDQVRAPTEALWAAWYVEGTPLNTGVRGGELPFIGSTTNTIFWRRRGADEWRELGNRGEHSVHMQVTTVPSPGLVCLAPIWLAFRRRRGSS